MQWNADLSIREFFTFQSFETEIKYDGINLGKVMLRHSSRDSDSSQTVVLL
jgi:hypothetical protein